MPFARSAETSPPARVITTFAGVLKSPFLKFASSELACTVQTPTSNDVEPGPDGLPAPCGGMLGGSFGGGRFVAPPLTGTDGGDAGGRGDGAADTTGVSSATAAASERVNRIMVRALS